MPIARAKKKPVMHPVFFFALIGCVVVLIIAALAFVAVTSSNNVVYAAVYLSNGDVYFGELHSFPRPYLTNALYLVRETDASGQPHFSVLPFDSSIWRPVDTVYLNPSEILFWSPLASDSEVVPLIENPTRLSEQSESQPSAVTASGSATSTASSTGQ